MCSGLCGTIPKFVAGPQDTGSIVVAFCDTFYFLPLLWEVARMLVFALLERHNAHGAPEATSECVSAYTSGDG